MYKLRPTLWRTCQVIACETRLLFLWNLFENKELYVAEMARITGTSAHNATTQLRVLNARGLIVFRREKMRVIYRPEANTEVDYAPELLETLKKCHEQSMPFETVIRQATAFTHERRIEIVQALDGSELTFCDLLGSTGMAPSSLSRYLEKLEARGFVKRVNGVYRLSHPGNLRLDKRCLKLYEPVDFLQTDGIKGARLLYVWRRSDQPAE